MGNNVDICTCGHHKSFHSALGLRSSVGCCHPLGCNCAHFVPRNPSPTPPAKIKQADKKDNKAHNIRNAREAGYNDGLARADLSGALGCQCSECINAYAEGQADAVQKLSGLVKR
jgi:hypothetical protein